MPRIAMVLALLAVFTPGLQGQETRNTGFLVQQLLVCPYGNMQEVNRLDALQKPILDEMVEEGLIRAWYSLRHAWGDEWNVGVVTIADSHRAWLDYWSEFVGRVNARHQSLFSDLEALCTMHKDNMYSVRDSGIDDS